MERRHGRDTKGQKQRDGYLTLTHQKYLCQWLRTSNVDNFLLKNQCVPAGVAWRLGPWAGAPGPLCMGY